jgi:hypothetical protein
VEINGLRRIEIASISDYELLLYDVRRLQKIPKDSIKTVVDKCWQSLNINAEPPNSLWELFLEAARLHPCDTFASMTLRFSEGCTETAVQKFNAFLDELNTRDSFRLNQFSPQSLTNFIKVITALNLKFSYAMIFKALKGLNVNSSVEAWTAFASMVDHVDPNQVVVADIRKRLDEFHGFILTHYDTWQGDSKFYAIKSLGRLSIITGKRYNFKDERIKDDIDTCGVDFGEMQERLQSAYHVTSMFTFGS